MPEGEAKLEELTSKKSEISGPSSFLAYAQYMGRASGGITASKSVGQRLSVSVQPPATASKARLQDSTAFAATIRIVLFPRAGVHSEDGFTIVRAIHEETGEEIVLKGKFGPVHAGELVQIARSTWRDDQRYGEFVQVWARAYSDPVTKDALLGYLGKLPGVGPVMAQAIVETYGTDCLSKIDADPQLLLQVRTRNGRHLHPDDMLAIIEP